MRQRTSGSWLHAYSLGSLKRARTNVAQAAGNQHVLHVCHNIATGWSVKAMCDTRKRKQADTQRESVLVCV